MPTETLSTHYQAAQPRFQVTWTSVGTTTPADPEGVQFDIIDPAGVVTTYVYLTDAELIKSGTGVYYVDFTLDQVGQWRIYVQATGANAKSVLHHATVCDYPPLA